MKVAHVTSCLSQSGAGVRAVVSALAKHLISSGVDVMVFGPDDEHWRQEKDRAWADVNMAPQVVRGPRHLAFMPGLTASLLEWQPDVVHIHGLWTLPSLSISRWHQRTKKPYVVSPHGMLAEVALGYSPKKKYLASVFFQERTLRESACLHATCNAELAEIRAYGLDNPVSIIPNGVADIRSTAGSTAVSTGRKVLLTLGRVHKKKGLDVLLDSWSLIQRRFPDWELKIVGPDEQNHTATLRAHAKKLSLERCTFLGAVYGTERDELMSKADLFVLPTRSENFALTVAESLMLEVPVVSSRGAPWSGLESHRCGKWVDLTPDSLAEGLSEMMSLTSIERKEMGCRGRRWMLEKFSWRCVADEMVKMYSWLATAEKKPLSVRRFV